jgi:hypothetical protein
MERSTSQQVIRSVMPISISANMESASIICDSFVLFLKDTLDGVLMAAGVTVEIMLFKFFGRYNKYNHCGDVVAFVVAIKSKDSLTSPTD